MMRNNVVDDEDVQLEFGTAPKSPDRITPPRDPFNDSYKHNPATRFAGLAAAAMLYLSAGIGLARPRPRSYEEEHHYRPNTEVMVMDPPRDPWHSIDDLTGSCCSDMDSAIRLPEPSEQYNIKIPKKESFGIFPGLSYAGQRI